MSELLEQMARLRRPKLLIRAAWFGQSDYNRRRDMKRLLAQAELPPPASALRALLELEATLEEARLNGTAAYSFLRHIEVLIAVMAEARLLAPCPNPPAASAT
ncbi:hypothetical protein SAMN05877809_10276 [Rhodobacter sp. JA431]|uniref:DUF6477 family protein n=1 Tax=Rhodobacter sp. JA431 TaxID=570013 RepID=UPI000BC3D424|nr:DUF6477 family protein [Rhodobacter sp. JA431]SOB97986.1 hypothetical protein SAMN05877809_10276 [Rhodobacter sp. JA431]